MDEEADLEADAADATAGGVAEGVEEGAHPVEVEGVKEEERVLGVEQVFDLVVNLTVDGEEVADLTVFADPAGTHGEGAVAASCREGVGAAVVDHYEGSVDVVLVGDG